MLSVPQNDPFANAPPDKVGVKRETQQIVQQHLFPGELDAPNHEFESDVDSGLSGCRVDDDFFLDNWTRPPLRYDEMPTFSTESSAYSGGCATPSASLGDSDSDHSTVGPLSPSSDFDAFSPEVDSTDYKDKDLFVWDEGTFITSGNPSGDFHSLPVEFHFCTQDTFAHATSFPCPSPLVWSGYEPPPRQHIDGAAPADVRGPPPTHDYPAVGSFPSTGVHSTIATRPEEDISHMNPCVFWSYDVSMDEGRAAIHSIAGINPSLLSMPVPQAASRCREASPYGQEQSQEHHYDVAPAGALGLGSGMQVSGYPGEVEVRLSSSPTLQFTVSGSPYPNHPTVPREHINKAGDDLTSKKTATTGEKKRKQSTEKVFACPWPGCSKAFARTNNLKVHEKSVHYRVRENVCPFAGCRKAQADNGFSRKYDLDVHVQKHHAAELGNMPTARNQK